MRNTFEYFYDLMYKYKIINYQITYIKVWINYNFFKYWEWTLLWNWWIMSLILKFRMWRQKILEKSRLPVLHSKSWACQDCIVKFVPLPLSPSKRQHSTFNMKITYQVSELSNSIFKYIISSCLLTILLGG